MVSDPRNPRARAAANANPRRRSRRNAGRSSGQLAEGCARGPQSALEAGRLEACEGEESEESRDRGQAPAGVARQERPSGRPGGVPTEHGVHGFGGPPARSKKTSESAPPRPEAVSRFRGEPRATSRPSTRRPAADRDLLGERELMCREQDGGALCGVGAQAFRKPALGERIETDHGLVENEDGGIVQKRLREGHALPRAVGEGLVALGGDLCRARRRRAPRRCALRAPLRGLRTSRPRSAGFLVGVHFGQR